MRTMGKCNVWVAEIPASAIMAMGLTIDPRPLAGTAERPAQPGHAVLRELNSQTRNSDRAQEWKHQLVLAVTGLTGPYAPPDGRVVAAAAPS